MLIELIQLFFIGSCDVEYFPTEPGEYGELKTNKQTFSLIFQVDYFKNSIFNSLFAILKL